MRSPAEWKKFRDENPTHPDVQFATRPIDKGLLARGHALAKDPDMIERQRIEQELWRGVTGGRNRAVDD